MITLQGFSVVFTFFEGQWCDNGPGFFEIVYKLLDAHLHIHTKYTHKAKAINFRKGYGVFWEYAIIQNGHTENRTYSI